MSDTTGLPDFLASDEAFLQRVAEALESDSSVEKGDAFVNLALAIIPLFDETRQYGPLTANERRSHDKGVDFSNAEGPDQVRLHGQAKYRITDVQTVDNIVSKFENFETELDAGPISLFPEEDGQAPCYVIVTTTDLSAIMTRYRRSAHSSVRFYNRLTSENRLHVFDGRRLFRKFQEMWRRTYTIPTDIGLYSAAGWVTSGDVAIGILSLPSLVALYEDHGDSIFFENIREYLGTEEDVNRRIRATMEEEPEKLVERNNGVTFRATDFDVDNDQKRMRLRSGALVNGCQTTMTAVRLAEDLRKGGRLLSEDCLLQVKVVRVDDAWAVANSANYQNPVSRIDLELAKWLRPQLVQRAAALEGVSVISSVGQPASLARTVNDLLDTFTRRVVQHDQVRHLFLGLFGNVPNELFNNNYDRIKIGVMNGYFALGDDEIQGLFQSLFQMADSSTQALEYCARHFADPQLQPVFRRFHESNRTNYASFMTLLALAAGTNIDLGVRGLRTEDDIERTRRFLSQSRDIMTNNERRFQQLFAATYTALGQYVFEENSERDVSQIMSRRIRDAGFSRLLQLVKMQLSLLDSGRQDR